jgi:hypothetical protein
MEVKNGNGIHYDVSDCPISPGTLVEESGIYEICHVDEPRVTVLLLRSTFFPSCKRCGDNVRYKLVQAVPHISEDPDFLEDLEPADNSPLNLIVPNTKIPFQLGVGYGFRFWQQLVQAWAGSTEGGNI